MPRGGFVQINLPVAFPFLAIRSDVLKVGNCNILIIPLLSLPMPIIMSNVSSYCCSVQ